MHNQTDENIAPSLKQSLHQRHKSTGALSFNMLGAGGLKAGAKRAAFGDVSNTARVLNTAQDDLITMGKNNGSENIKPYIQEKTNVLSRPAQRPLSAVVKNLLGHNQSAITTTNKVSIIPSINPSQVARPRALSKRTTTIYKDENSAELVQALQPTNPQTNSIGSAPVPPVHQTLGPRQHKSQPQLKIDQPVLRRTQSKYMADDVSATANEVVPAPFRSDSESEQAREEPSEQTAENSSYDSQPHKAPVQLDINTDPLETEAIAHRHESFDREERQLPVLPLVSEPEEYWEEEEEGEVYDEQGYTTAHSNRSRGENTTGGATTVMFPKVSGNIERELAAAKFIVDGSRTREEIEDDAWDTSMVAEYGDEIFTYMRELEVSTHRIYLSLIRAAYCGW